MKLFLFASLVLAALAVWAQIPDEAAVRKQLDARYAGLAKANEDFDTEKVFSFRSKDFHAIGPDGRVMDAKMMEDYTRGFMKDNKPPLKVSFTIQQLRLSPNGQIAVATVFQQVSRYRDQMGKKRKVDTSVLQNETWVQANGTWKLKLVDSVHDQKRFVDGKRVDPTVPYDPEAPEFNPDKGQLDPLTLRYEVGAASAKAATQGMVAWKLRDPDMLMEAIPKDFNVKQADGTVMTWDSLYASQKERMANLKHVDHLVTTIEVVSADTKDAVVLSSHDWSRVVHGPNGDVRLVTGVTHREIWHRVDGGWKMEKFTEENPTRKQEENAKISDSKERYEVRVKAATEG